MRLPIVQPDHGVAPVIDFLRSAKSEILIKQFTFDHPLLLEELLSLHKRGVHVRVMLNGAKATGERINDATFAALENAGIAVEWSCPNFLVTHEKSIVVDREAALLATFNFMEKYFSDTRDYGIITTDPTSVDQLIACFEHDWQRTEFKPQHSHQLAWSPGNARSLVCDLLDGAEKSIDIQHPKFAEPVIFERVHAALKRGVEVRVLCGGRHGIHQPDLMHSFALWRVLRELGGRVHKQRNLRSHGKLIIADNIKALVSSQNIDQPAFDVRREVGIIVESGPVVKILSAIFQSDWEASRRYEPPYPTEQLDESEEAELFHANEIQHG